MREEKPRRVLVIGIDGGTFRVLEPAMEAGRMPFLASLKREGAFGVLRSTIPAITPAAWACFQTGMNPGRTGVYDFMRWIPEERSFAAVSSALLPLTLWERLSRAGKTVAVLNVPLTWPARKIKGALVCGFPAPEVPRKMSHPPELWKELKKELPAYRVFMAAEPSKLFLETEAERFVSAMKDALQTRTRAARWLLSRLSPDLFMVHFHSPDFIQHGLWPFLDPAHPLYSSSRHEELLEKFYAALDQAAAEVAHAFAEAVGEDYLLIVASDHGFQAHRKRFNLGTWLVEKGLAIPKSEPGRQSRTVSALRAMDVFNLRKRFLPDSLRRRGSRFLHKLEGVESWQDYNSSRAMSMGKGEGLIFLLDQDPDEREQLCARLEKELLSLCDPDSRKPVVRKVHRKRELYRGPRLNSMPDLVVEMAEGYSCNGTYLPAAALFEEITPGKTFHAGIHHPEGVFMGTGPGLVKGETQQARLIDLPATLLYYFGLPLPRDLDGEPALEWFSRDFLEANPVQRSPGEKEVGPEPEKESETFTPEEEEKLKKQLKDLGYL